jgi:FkbM family methyltransferase
MPRAVKLLLLIVVLAAAAAAGGYFFSPVRLFVIAAFGGSPVCPMAQAIKSADNLRIQIQLKDRILNASKLLEKDPKGYHLWDTPHGKFWIPEGSDYVLPFNLAEQERRIYGTGDRAVRAGDIVLDCGANVGVYTKVALDAGAKKIVAIEPAPENVECLRRNFAPEIASGRVILYPKGVWDKNDTLTLNVDPHNSAADSFIIHRDGAVSVIKIPVTAIDDLVRELNLERVDFIKMDIEGAEQKALIGAQSTLMKYHPRMALSAYHVPSDPERIPALARQAWPGYNMECGPCAEANGSVRPDVLYFY